MALEVTLPDACGSVLLRVTERLQDRASDWAGLFYALGRAASSRTDHAAVVRWLTLAGNIEFGLLGDSDTLGPLESAFSAELPEVTT